MILRAALAIVLAAGLSAGCTIDADGDGLNISFSEQEAPEFHWDGAIAAGKTLEIKGVNGSIQASPAGGDRVELVATRKGRSDPAQVKIEVVEHEGGVTVCAIYPTRAGDEPNVCKPGEGGRLGGRSNVNVAFNVQVPPGVRFVARNTNGSVTAMEMKSDVFAHTENGSVKFSTEGYGEGSTTNGSVNATLGRTDWSGALKFNTVNGSVRVALPADAQTAVDARCVNGSVSVDFPLASQSDSNRRHVTGVIGAGGRELAIATVNGGVHVGKATE